uniref:class II aldolase/adducin family protein n=1 Tax=Streptomyces diastaticus TaxID=1956 RepID=UPI0035309E55
MRRAGRQAGAARWSSVPLPRTPSAAASVRAGPVMMASKSEREATRYLPNLEEPATRTALREHSRAARFTSTSASAGDARATPASGPGARAVVHPRSRHATAVSCLPPWSRRSAVPPLTPYFVMRVGQTPLLPHAAPGDAGQARERERQDHGPVVSGGSVRAAVDAAVGLEEVCAPVLALGDRPARLPTEEEAGEPAGRYGSCWGGE